jgi:hypothetical protein
MSDIITRMHDEHGMEYIKHCLAKMTEGIEGARKVAWSLSTEELREKAGNMIAATIEEISGQPGG